MKIYLVTRGTDGMGKQLALRLLKDGEQVSVVGRNSKKRELFLADTEQMGGFIFIEFLSLMAMWRSPNNYYKINCKLLARITEIGRAHV